MNNKKVIGILAIVVIIIAVVFLQMREGGEKWNGVAGEPIDIAIDFYTNWVHLQDIEATADQLNTFLETAPMAAGVKEMLKSNLSADIDPVACRAFDEVEVRTRKVFEREDTAQYIMQVTKGDPTEGYAVVDLSGRGGEWQIENVECAYGDVAPERGEFNFDQVGGLLKNVPAPYDANFWHLVFETEGQIGVVPLRFADGSECVTAEGNAVSCDEGFLVEAMDVHVYGHLDEAGAEVVRVEAI